MLRLCSRKLLDVSQLRTLSSIPVNCTSPKILDVGVRRFSAQQSAAPTPNPEYPCRDPDNLLSQYMWVDVEDWDMDWYDGRDVLHIRVKKTEDATSFRGISFYSREGYWMGALRWNERLRGDKPAVWLHWVGKDPIEIATSLPKPDHDGRYTFSMSFKKQEFVMHCNGELLGVRKNMSYQYKNVARVWFADLQEVGGKYLIEGQHTNDSGYTTYNDVPMFKKMTDIWRAYRQIKDDHDEQTFPDQGWRS